MNIINNSLLYPGQFRSEHYVLWKLCSGHYLYCSMTHYDITIGNDVARYVHCEIIMDHGIVMVTYHDVTMHTDVATVLIYYVLLCPIMICLFS